MNTIKMYLLLALGWCGVMWNRLVHFAPWKAFLIVGLIQTLLMVSLDFTLDLVFHWRMPSLLHFVISVGTFFFLYIKAYPHIYPNGWQGR